jgi:SAM-dependent methyltransferase
MHKTSWEMMLQIIATRCQEEKSLNFIDIGSLSQGTTKWQAKTYREIMRPGWTYQGFDLEAGNNVDVVMPDPDQIPLPDNAVDVVISGQCLEHTEYPWVLVEEMFRVLKPGGQIFVTAPAVYPLHRFPFDCWRFYPDGMAALLRWPGFERIITWVNRPEVIRIGGKKGHADCWGIGVKP